MIWKLSHCPLASLQAVKEKKLRQSTDKDYIFDNAKAKTMRFLSRQIIIYIELIGKDLR